MENTHPELDTLVRAIRATPKYAMVAPDVLRHIGAQELAKGRGLKESIKATRNKLHQVGGAYLDRRVPYAQWGADLQSALQQGGIDALRPLCSRLMSLHASTRERLPILDAFYADIFRALPPIHSVLDLACGFNPLALPWMPLAPGAHYTAVDIYTDLMAFLHDFIGLCAYNGEAIAHSVLDVPFTQAVSTTRHYDLVLLLKAIPCLEQVDKTAGEQLLTHIQADHILVSFPSHSLGGRSKGMTAHYEAHFHDLIMSKGFRIQKFTYSSELAFLISRSANHSVNGVIKPQ
jgi:16S rRNA (guanine(1405)-N(7))-methyltransferase